MKIPEKTNQNLSPWTWAAVTCLTPLLTISCNANQDMPHNRKPNIVLIFADDMGYGDVGALNPEARTHTPAIDRMVEDGLTFTQAHASASVCTPSRYGLLTGRYAHRTSAAARGVWGFNEPVIEPGRETTASLLKKAGYATAIIGKWHLGLGWQTKDGSKAVLNEISGFSNVDYTREIENGPNDYGFDYSFIHPASLDIPPYMFLRDHKVIDTDIILTTDHYPARMPDTEYSWDKKHSNEHAVYWEKGVWWRLGEMSRSFRIEKAHPDILNEGIAYIEKQATEQPETPFFLFMPLLGPHTPWVPTDRFRGRSSIGLYGDFIMDIDDVVYQVRNKLIEHGIHDNTILIFASDNGGYWPQEEIDLHNHDSNWGRKGQKGDIWDGGHRIPLVVTWPERIAGQTEFNHVVSLTDFFATFAELTGQEMDEDMGDDSFSFLRVFDGDTEEPTRRSMVHHSSRGMYSIRTDEWKFIDGLGSGGFSYPYFEDQVADGPKGQLYSLKTDSLESVNMYLRNPDIVGELEKKLETFKNSTERTVYR